MEDKNLWDNRFNEVEEKAFNLYFNKGLIQLTTLQNIRKLIKEIKEELYKLLSLPPILFKISKKKRSQLIEIENIYQVFEFNFNLITQ